MLTTIKQEIIKDKQIKKFCLYGFLKDLKFFEPYLLIFLMSKDITLFEIGILISIREIIINLFEIPSGFMADYFGRKKQLCVSFIFYIISFIFFYFTNNFVIAIFAMIFFGLGESFRSGTHKAMIYTYLNAKGYEKEKTFVYGRTRSFSLIGTAVSSLIGILLIIKMSNINLIFLASIVPYLINFVLVLSYPSYLDKNDKKVDANVKSMLKDTTHQVFLNKPLRNILLEDGLFSATISFIKDLIQPLLELIVVGSGIIIISSLDSSENLKVILGLVYATLNLLGSYSSKKSYVFKKNNTNLHCLFKAHLILTIIMLVLALVNKNMILVLILYLFIYALFNVRKPIFFDEIDEHINKSERATILSVSSQLKSIFLMAFAPILGYVVDHFGINIVMYILSFIFLITLPLVSKNKKALEN